MAGNTEILDTLIECGIVEGLCEIFSTSTEKEVLV